MQKHSSELFFSTNIQYTLEDSNWAIRLKMVQGKTQLLENTQHRKHVCRQSNGGKKGHVNDKTRVT